VIVATLQAMGREVDALFDDSPTYWGTNVLGVPIRGPIAAVRDSTCTRAIIGVGDNHVRKRISHEIEIEWTTAVPSILFGPSGCDPGPW